MKRYLSIDEIIVFKHTLGSCHEYHPWTLWIHIGVALSAMFHTNLLVRLIILQVAFNMFHMHERHIYISLTRSRSLSSSYNRWGVNCSSSISMKTRRAVKMATVHAAATLHICPSCFVSYQWSCNSRPKVTDHDKERSIYVYFYIYTYMIYYHNHGNPRTSTFGAYPMRYWSYATKRRIGGSV